MNCILPLQFQIFQEFPNLKQAFSTRTGGVSRAPYDSLNLGLHSGDHFPDVKKNRKLFFQHMGIEGDHVVYPEQTHSANIAVVIEPGTVQNCDALITNKTNLFLSIQTADCFPVFLFDPDKSVVALVHSGWRGTAQNIVGKTLIRLQGIFNSNTTNLLAAIGPGVLQRNYQVDTLVAKHFSDTYLIKDGPGHFKLDIRQAIYNQLLDGGVQTGNIEIIPVCSFEEKGLFYSYRRDGQKSGRMMGIIGLTD